MNNLHFELQIKLLDESCNQINDKLTELMKKDKPPKINAR